MAGIKGTSAWLARIFTRLMVIGCVTHAIDSYQLPAVLLTKLQRWQVDKRGLQKTLLGQSVELTFQIAYLSRSVAKQTIVVNQTTQR